MWPMLLDTPQEDCRRSLRKIELDAFGAVISAFRAQGQLSPEKKKFLRELSVFLGITMERYKGEIRRVTGDERLYTIAERLHPDGGSAQGWGIEGRRVAPILTRVVPERRPTPAVAAANERARLDSEAMAAMSQKRLALFGNVSLTALADAAAAAQRQYNRLMDNPANTGDESRSRPIFKERREPIPFTTVSFIETSIRKSRATTAVQTNISGRNIAIVEDIASYSHHDGSVTSSGTTAASAAIHTPTVTAGAAHKRKMAAPPVAATNNSSNGGQGVVAVSSTGPTSTAGSASTTAPSIMIGGNVVAPGQVVPVRKGHAPKVILVSAPGQHTTLSPSSGAPTTSGPRFRLRATTPVQKKRVQQQQQQHIILREQQQPQYDVLSNEQAQPQQQIVRESASAQIMVRDQKTGVQQIVREVQQTNVVSASPVQQVRGGVQQRSGAMSQQQQQVVGGQQQGSVTSAQKIIQRNGGAPATPQVVVPQKKMTTTTTMTQRNVVQQQSRTAQSSGGIVVPSGQTVVCEGGGSQFVAQVVRKLQGTPLSGAKRVVVSSPQIVTPKRLQNATTPTTVRPSSPAAALHGVTKKPIQTLSAPNTLGVRKAVVSSSSASTTLSNSSSTTNSVVIGSPLMISSVTKLGPSSVANAASSGARFVSSSASSSPVLNSTTGIVTTATGTATQIVRRSTAANKMAAPVTVVSSSSVQFAASSAPPHRTIVSTAVSNSTRNVVAVSSSSATVRNAIKVSPSGKMWINCVTGEPVLFNTTMSRDLAGNNNGGATNVVVLRNDNSGGCGEVSGGSRGGGNSNECDLLGEIVNASGIVGEISGSGSHINGGTATTIATSSGGGGNNVVQLVQPTMFNGTDTWVEEIGSGEETFITNNGQDSTNIIMYEEGEGGEVTQLQLEEDDDNCGVDDYERTIIQVAQWPTTQDGEPTTHLVLTGELNGTTSATTTTTVVTNDDGELIALPDDDQQQQEQHEVVFHEGDKSVPPVGGESYDNDLIRHHHNASSHMHSGYSRAATSS